MRDPNARREEIRCPVGAAFCTRASEETVLECGGRFALVRKGRGGSLVVRVVGERGGGEKSGEMMWEG